MTFDTAVQLSAPSAGIAATDFQHSGEYQFGFFGEPHASRRGPSER